MGTRQKFGGKAQKPEARRYGIFYVGEPLGWLIIILEV
jgi:hypothetical protein